MILHQYPFSAHVVEHLLFALVIPAFVVLAAPRFDLRRVTKLAHPPISWILGVGTMLLWHIPVLFTAAMSHDALQVFELLSLLATGTIFWWPVLGPMQGRHLSPLAAVIYLFSACSSCTLLGAYLTFGPPGLYAAHEMGLNPHADQQLGGLLMWVPGCFVYLSAILFTVQKWYREAPLA